MNNADNTAYPIVVPETATENGLIIPGLTKREYFAALAMIGFTQSYSISNHDFRANLAVEQADALLKELEKQ